MHFKIPKDIATSILNVAFPDAVPPLINISRGEDWN